MVLCDFRHLYRQTKRKATIRGPEKEDTPRMTGVLPSDQICKVGIFEAFPDLPMRIEGHAKGGHMNAFSMPLSEWIRSETAQNIFPELSGSHSERPQNVDDL